MRAIAHSARLTATRPAAMRRRRLHRTSIRSRDAGIFIVVVHPAEQDAARALTPEIGASDTLGLREAVLGATNRRFGFMENRRKQVSNLLLLSETIRKVMAAYQAAGHRRSHLIRATRHHETTHLSTHAAAALNRYGITTATGKRDGGVAARSSSSHCGGVFRVRDPDVRSIT